MAETDVSWSGKRFAKQNVIALTVIALLILYVFMASIFWLVAPLTLNDFGFPDDWQLIFPSEILWVTCSALLLHRELFHRKPQFCLLLVHSEALRGHWNTIRESSPVDAKGPPVCWDKHPGTRLSCHGNDPFIALAGSQDLLSAPVS